MTSVDYHLMPWQFELRCPTCTFLLDCSSQSAAAATAKPEADHSWLPRVLGILGAPLLAHPLAHTPSYQPVSYHRPAAAAFASSPTLVSFSSFYCAAEAHEALATSSACLHDFQALLQLLLCLHQPQYAGVVAAAAKSCCNWACDVCYWTLGVHVWDLPPYASRTRAYAYC